MASRRRARYGGLGSRFLAVVLDWESALLCSPEAISFSICCVTSGKAGAPSGVENLMPLYSGGLWEAVKLIAPSAFSCITAYEMAGVGAGSAISRGVMPWAMRISSAMEQKV